MSNKIQGPGIGDLHALQLLRQQDVKQREATQTAQSAGEQADLQTQELDPGEQLLLAADWNDVTQRVLLDGSVSVPPAVSGGSDLAAAVDQALAFISTAAP